MEFYVVGDNGDKYGPADLATLNQWIADGRLLPNSKVERSADGIQGLASQVPGLNFGPVSAPGNIMGDAPAQASYADPTAAYGAVPPGQFVESGYPRARNTYDPNVVPAEIMGRFNWGAFFWNWIWGLNHKAYITLHMLTITITAYALEAIAKGAKQATVVSVIVGIGWILQLAFSIYLGKVGNQLAWKSGRFESVDHFNQVQRAWVAWGIGFCACSVVGAIFAGVGLGAMALAMPH